MKEGGRSRKSLFLFFISFFVIIMMSDLSFSGSPISSGNQQSLQELNWLLGKWVHKGKDTNGNPLLVTRTCKWSLNGNYMTVLTTIRVKGKLSIVRRHMVGWDAVNKRLNSWIFSSNGEFAHGIWQEYTGKKRSGKVMGLQPDGQKMSAIVTYIRLADNAFIYKVRNMVIGEEPQPDITWKFVRVTN